MCALQKKNRELGFVDFSVFCPGLCLPGTNVPGDKVMLSSRANREDESKSSINTKTLERVGHITHVIVVVSQDSFSLIQIRVMVFFLCRRKEKEKFFSIDSV